MQIITHDIKRPKLFDSFLDAELDYKNEYVEYIDVTSKTNNNIIHKKSLLRVTPFSKEDLSATT